MRVRSTAKPVRRAADLPHGGRIAVPVDVLDHELVDLLLSLREHDHLVATWLFVRVASEPDGVNRPLQSPTHALVAEWQTRKVEGLVPERGVEVQASSACARSAGRFLA